MLPLMTYCSALHTAQGVQLLGICDVDKHACYTTDLVPRKEVTYLLPLEVVAPASGLRRLEGLGFCAFLCRGDSTICQKLHLRGGQL